MKRGTLVVYGDPGLEILAVIRRAHRDGSFTVEPRFFLDSNGRWLRGYIGGAVRLLPSDLRCRK